MGLVGGAEGAELAAASKVAADEAADEAAADALAASVIGGPGSTAAAHVQAAAAAAAAASKSRVARGASHGLCTYADGSTYRGEWLLGKRHGHGLYTANDGTSYEGAWQYDGRHGVGALRTAEGLCYEGEWRHDCPSGDGKVALPSGVSVEGAWVDGAPGARMTLTRPPGDVYTGSLRRLASRAAMPASADPAVAAAAAAVDAATAGTSADRRHSLPGKVPRLSLQHPALQLATYEPHGRGSMAYANGEGYEGDWEAGVPHGFGTATYGGGESYTGDWVDGEPSGEGAYAYADGAVYRGELEKRLRHGVGRCTYAGGATYEGGWRQDVWHSAADESAHAHAGQPSSLYHSAEGHRFEGPFVDGTLRGRGLAQYRHGDKYDGDFEGFDRHGEGTCSYGVGGGVYKGQVRLTVPCRPQLAAHSSLLAESAPPRPPLPCHSQWSKDMREGRGRLEGRAGEVYEGQWLADRPHGTGARVGADGSREEGQFGWGALHGAAMRRDALGNVWRGVFVGGQLQGEATCEVDGGAYAGGFIDNLYGGEGTRRCPTSSHSPAVPLPQLLALPHL